MSTLTLDVGLAAKLKVAFARNGWTEELIDKACEGDKLGQFREVLLGNACIVMNKPASAPEQPQVMTRIIDCDAGPYLPDGWKGVEEHQKGGSFIWDKEAQKNALYIAEAQKQPPWFKGHKLREELAGNPVMNANVLDYLLAHPKLIPESWKGQYVFFWGTIYRDRDGDLCVRCLYWFGGRWLWGFSWLVSGFYGSNPAAVRAS